MVSGHDGGRASGPSSLGIKKRRRASLEMYRAAASA
jgi:hypothetical protein